MPRQKMKKSSTAGRRQEVLAKWEAANATTSRRAFAKTYEISEGTLRQWISNADAIKHATHSTDIYISKKQSKTVRWVCEELHKREELTAADVSNFMAAEEPDRVNGASYDNRRRMAERALQRGIREEMGFTPIMSNVSKSEECVIVNLPDRICKCVKYCRGNCWNRRHMIECNNTNCTIEGNCGNRRFARYMDGDRSEIQRKAVARKGDGVFAVASIQKGTLIAEYTGDIIGKEEYVARAACDRDEYIMELEGDQYIDAMHYGSFARLINHACKANAWSQLWYVNRVARVGIFAQKLIKPGTEITINYGNGYRWTSSCSCDTCLKKRKTK